MNEKDVYRLVNALGAIGKCATACPCCKAHRDIANQALELFERRTQITEAEAYAALQETGQEPQSD